MGIRQRKLISNFIKVLKFFLIDLRLLNLLIKYNNKQFIIVFYHTFK